MSSKIPVARKAAWISIVPQLAFMFLLIVLCYLIMKDWYSGIIWGCIVYLLISRLTKTIFLKHHKKGMRFLRQSNFESAMVEFQKSYDYLTKHPWIDKFRYLVMLDSSKIPYTEMALINTAVCHIKLNDIHTGLKYYKKALELFPDSFLAKNAIQEIEIHLSTCSNQNSAND